MNGKSEIPTEVLDALFSAPREEFVKLRDRKARELASSGASDEAKALRALKKPTVAAWAMNQVARTDPAKATAILDAYRKLRAADSPTAFRAASAE